MVRAGPGTGRDTCPRSEEDLDAGEVEHSAHEHDEGNAALLALMEVGDPRSEEFRKVVRG